MRQRPVAIGLPVFNGERFVARALSSLLNQTFRDFSVTVCDNASTDGTRDILERFRSQDDRVSIVTNASNIGAVRNFARVLELAPPAEFFAWFAADDEYEPRFLESLLAELDDPATAGAMSDVQHMDEAGKLGAITAYDGLRRTDDWEKGRARFFAFGTDTCFFAYALFRASTLRRVPPLRPWTRSGLMWRLEDGFLAQLAVLGRLVSIPEPLFRYRNHDAAGRVDMIAGMSRWDYHLSNLLVTEARFRSAIRSDLSLRGRLRLAATSLASLGTTYAGRVVSRSEGRA